MDGWWCVRYGDALAWIEAPSASRVLRRSIELYPLGDWTNGASELVVFPLKQHLLGDWTGDVRMLVGFLQDSHPAISGRHVRMGYEAIALPHYVDYAPVAVLTNADSSERSEAGAVGVVHVAAHCGPPVAEHDCDEIAAG